MSIRVVESSLSRIWQHIEKSNSTFAVISAYRQDLYTEEENLERHEELRKVIKSMSYGFIEQKSGYSYKDEEKDIIGIREEKSFFIPSIEFEDAIFIGSEFQQESILYKDSTIFGLFYCSNGKLDFAFKKDEETFSFSKKDIEIAYSELIRGNQNQKVKFSYIAEKYIPNSTDGYRALKTREMPIQGWICSKEMFFD
jgi:hypothetical protein